MALRPEYAPGETAPATGTYELLNVFGRATGIRASVTQGHPFPAAPRSHRWTPAGTAAAHADLSCASDKPRRVDYRRKGAHHA